MAATFSTVQVPLCGYNKYRLDGICYEFNSNKNQRKCPLGFYNIDAYNISFLGVGKLNSACLYKYTKYIYPTELRVITNGFLVNSSIPLNVFANLSSVKCLVQPDEYYQVVPVDNVSFDVPSLALCADNMLKYVVLNDCKDVVNYRGNPVCAVLCDTGVYTNVGTCADSYCSVDGKNRRIFVNNNGVIQSVPLYSSKITTPSLNVRFGNAPGQTCYMNLIDAPSDKPFRVKYNDKKYYSID